MKLKGPWELYDIEADRTEQHDLVNEQPELAKNLAADWEAWAKRADVDSWPGFERNDSGAELRKDQTKTRNPRTGVVD